VFIFRILTNNGDPGCSGHRVAQQHSTANEAEHAQFRVRTFSLSHLTVQKLLMPQYNFCSHSEHLSFPRILFTDLADQYWQQQQQQLCRIINEQFINLFYYAHSTRKKAQ